jgi:ligand-binding sensor domain-containing protein
MIRILTLLLIKLLKKAFFILLTLGITTSTLGQAYTFKHLSSAQGLLSDLRLLMAEDRMGRLWVASDEGINIFDGNKLDSYSQIGNSGLIDNNITQLFCDKAGTIWIKSNIGIQFKKESDTKFKALSTNEEDLNNTDFFGETTDGGLLCVTKKEIYKLNKQLQINKIPAFSGLFKKYGNPLTFSLFDNATWFIGFEKKLVLINLSENKIIKEYDCTQAWSVCKINDSSAIVGSFVKDSIGLLNIKSGNFECINNYKTNDGLPIFGFVGSIAPMGNNKYALACRMNGIYIVDIANKYATHFIHDPSDPTTIRSEFCRRALVSRSGTLFVHSRGISYTNINPKSIFSQKYLINKEGKKYDGEFNNFVQDAKENMWIATNSSLAMWNRQTGISTYYPFYDSQEGPQKFKPIQTVALDKLGHLWVGTFGGGIGMLKNDGSYEKYKKNATDINNNIPGNDVNALVNSNQQDIFICCNSGFALLNPVTKKITTFFNHPKLKGIAKNTTFYAMTDKEDNWWLAQDSGLYYYNKIIDSLYYFKQPKASFNKAFSSIAVNDNGDVYAGNADGVFLIKKGTFNLTFLLGKKEGLPSNNIKRLQFDKEGLLWILGNRGLSNYNPATKILKALDAKDGDGLDNHNLCNFYFAPDGEMFIGSTEGFNYFYPNKLKTEVDSLKVFISSLQFQDSIISNPNLDNLFVLKHSQNSLTISFLTVDFNFGSSIQYRYKLLGLDTSYTYAGEQRQVKYSNLAAGKYTFIVEASGNGKNWYAAKSLDIKIKATFWTTWWFKIIVLLLLWGLIYAAYRYRITQLNNQAKLRTDYEVKLSELEMSALRTQMNPHFIFNSLNTINSFINLNNSAQANIYITKFSRLLRLILDHSRKKKITLKEELNVVELYLQMEQIRFENKFIYSITIDENVEVESTEVPPLIIQPFVENSILHGVLPSTTKGLVKVAIFRQGDKIICTIYDNGIGRKNANLLRNSNNAEKRQSHGMEITLKRIGLFNKEYNLEEDVQINDLENPTGTQVIITLAYSESY